MEKKAPVSNANSNPDFSIGYFVIAVLVIMIIFMVYYIFNQPSQICVGDSINKSSEAVLNESFELYLGDCINKCGDGLCQELTCEINVKQAGAHSTITNRCDFIEQKRLFKEYWDDLRYFRADVTCPETAENCPSDCSDNSKNDLMIAQGIGRDYVQNLSEYRGYNGGNLMDRSQYDDFSRGVDENGNYYYDLSYFFNVRSEKLPWKVDGYNVNLTVSQGKVLNASVSKYIIS